MFAANRSIISLRKATDWRILLSLSVILLLSSCGSSKKVAVSQHASDKDLPAVVEKRKPQRHNGKADFDVDKQVGKRLVAAAKEWIGTPYKYGGQNKDGTDCSGLTMVLFKEVAGVAIPRNSARQCEYCVSIGREDLQVGDLIFFSGKAGGESVGHVGLYIGNGEMIHASSSRGVITSSIDDRYWRNHYFGSGRVNATTYAMTGRKPGKSTPPPVDIPEPAEPELAMTVPKPNPVVNTKKTAPAQPVSIAEDNRPIAQQMTASLPQQHVQDTAELPESSAKPSVDDIRTTEDIPTVEDIRLSVEAAFN